MPDLTVYYDSQCPLCRREIALMRRLDKRERISFLAIADLSDGACPIDRRALLARFHAKENGKLLSGAAAFAAMWRTIPMLRPLGLAARLAPFGWVLEGLYQVYLFMRPALQRLAGGRLSEDEA